MGISVTISNLDAISIPLSGRHLIEASAGTGKTHNITRIYLRLVAELGIAVQNLLVMTFTKAATEELRGRIDAELRRAMAEWDALSTSEPFYIELASRVDAAVAKQRLSDALLFLDEGAIHTIHGFCRRALSEQAFTSGLPMEVTLEADSAPLLWQAVRDWLRQVSEDEKSFNLLEAAGWETPDAFYNQFTRALNSATPVTAPTETEILEQLSASRDAWLSTVANPQRAVVLQHLLSHQGEIFDTLVTKHKDREKRADEWNEIIGWLQADGLVMPPKALNDFTHGNRYRGNDSLKMIFSPLRNLRDAFNERATELAEAEAEQVNAAPLSALVCSGIATIRERFVAAKRQQAMVDFNDLIQLLSERLATDDGAPLLEALREQYPVALVDEFQDTDPGQYAILERMFPCKEDDRLLLMIGDPKQAIYGFRGGDIFTYLTAGRAADYHWHMGTNWRSIADVVNGYNRLFWGAPLSASPADVFGYGIGYEQVVPAGETKASAAPLTDADRSRAALTYVHIQDDADCGSAKADQRQVLARWCAAEIARLLADATLGDSPLREQDIAVLVRSGREADVIRDALRAIGYPSVYLSERENLFASAEAIEVLRVLDGLLNYENDRLLVAALSTRLMGGDAALLGRLRDPSEEDLWQSIRDDAAALRGIWSERGAMALMVSLIQQRYIPAPHQHERGLTNMIHLAEQLQSAARQYKHPQQLRKWLAEQIAATESNAVSGDSAQLRLESDANLIRVVTQHSSKGLEYPVVFIPFASDYRDPAMGGKTTLSYFDYQDLSANIRKRQIGISEEALRETREQGRAESVRLLYVAVTRAMHRCYLGVAASKESHRSPLGLALGMTSDAQWEEALAHLVDTSNGTCARVSAMDVPAVTGRGRAAGQQGDQEVVIATMPHAINDRWGIHSFSGIVRNSHIALPVDYDRAAIEVPADADGADAFRFSMRRGTEAGVLLHSVLQQVDLSAPNWDWCLDEAIRRSTIVKAEDKGDIVDWLNEALAAPLPPIHADAPALSLASLQMPQTLRECSFHFTLKPTSMSAITKLLSDVRGNEFVALPSHGQLEGMMHGFIDLIFEHGGRFYLADYKSSHLGNAFAGYMQPQMAANVATNNYDLQYLIYSLALHRYLRTRIPGYDPALHFGGAYYLYLRGMSPEAPGAGVYGKAISVELLDRLDGLMG